MNRTFLCLAVAFAAVTPDIRGATLVFVNVIDSTSPQFSAFGSAPSINNAGTVAFIAARDAGGTGVFTKSGAAPTVTIADSATSPVVFNLNSEQGTSINSSGTVAFAANLPGDLTQEGVFTGNGGPLGTIALTTGAQFDDFGPAPFINDNGTVVFSGQRDAGPSGIYAYTSGTIATVDEGSTRYGRPMINNQGTVVFSVRASGVFTRKGTAPVVTIADTTGPLDGAFAFQPVINDAGTVVFDAEGDDLSEGIYSGNGGALTTVVDDAEDFSSFENTIAINAAGLIVFNGLPVVEEDGIFFGPNPATDAIIKEGDALFGSTVKSIGLAFGPDSLNDLGQFVFRYQLVDGRSGIAMVTVPEPGTSTLAVGFGLVVARVRRRA